VQEEGFDEDEGIYDDLNLDEEEEKFGLAPEDDDSEDSEVGSEGLPVNYVCVLSSATTSDLPRPSSKKHDEESVTSSKQNDSPILKKAAATIQLRSNFLLFQGLDQADFSVKNLPSIVGTYTHYFTCRSYSFQPQQDPRQIPTSPNSQWQASSRLDCLRQYHGQPRCLRCVTPLLQREGAMHRRPRSLRTATYPNLCRMLHHLRLHHCHLQILLRYNLRPLQYHRH
jgi:CCR4-NOT transcriptional regulation complex NOT5 subunit